MKEIELLSQDVQDLLQDIGHAFVFRAGNYERILDGLEGRNCRMKSATNLTTAEVKDDILTTFGDIFKKYDVRAEIKRNRLYDSIANINLNGECIFIRFVNNPCEFNHELSNEATVQGSDKFKAFANEIDMRVRTLNAKKTLNTFGMLLAVGITRQNLDSIHAGIKHIEDAETRTLCNISKANLDILHAVIQSVEKQIELEQTGKSFSIPSLEDVCKVVEEENTKNENSLIHDTKLRDTSENR